MLTGETDKTKAVAGEALLVRNTQTSQSRSCEFKSPLNKPHLLAVSAIGGGLLSLRHTHKLSFFLRGGGSLRHAPISHIEGWPLVVSGAGGERRCVRFTGTCFLEQRGT